MGNNWSTNISTSSRKITTIEDEQGGRYNRLWRTATREPVRVLSAEHGITMWDDVGAKNQQYYGSTPRRFFQVPTEYYVGEDAPGFMDTAVRVEPSKDDLSKALLAKK